MTDHVRLMVKEGYFAGDSELIGSVIWAGVHGVVSLYLAGAVADGGEFERMLAETMRTILTDPNFKGPGDKFDHARFQATLRQFGFSEQRYVADQRKVSLRRQIAGTISAGVEPPKAMMFEENCAGVGNVPPVNE